MKRSERAYNAPARVLHWLTVALMTTQFVIGYGLDAESSGRGRGRGRGGGAGRGRGRGGDGWDFDDSMLQLHIALGVTILAVGLVRLWWRRRSGLPPWAETLSRRERAIAHYTERALLTLQFAVPLSGLYLLRAGDDAIAFHVATHVCFFVAIAAHVGLVLKHQFLHRDGLLRRML